MSAGAIFIVIVVVLIALGMLAAAVYDRTRGHEVATDEERLNQPHKRRWLWRR